MPFYCLNHWLQRFHRMRGWHCLNRLTPKALLLAICAVLMTPALANAADAGSATPDTAETETAPPTLPLSPRPAKPVRMDIQRAEALASALADTDSLSQPHWFRDAEDTRFLGLYRADTSGNPLGSLLLLHDNQHHPDWPGALSLLRRAMTEHGWHTLSIAIPDYWPPQSIPPRVTKVVVDTETQPADQPEGEGAAGKTPSKTADRTSDKAPNTSPNTSQNKAAQQPAGQPAEQTANQPLDQTASEPRNPWHQRAVEVPAQEFANEFSARLELAGEYLRQQSDRPVVAVAFGETAAWLVNQLAAGKGSIQGLVIINIAEPTDTELKLTENLAKLNLPILDLAPRYTPRHDPKLRRLVMQQAGLSAYEQRLLAISHARLTDMDKQIVRAVRGWAERQLQLRR